jgi:hypothetical protein
MSFCTKCGRPRTGSQFCGGCGHDFGEQAPDSGTPLRAQPGTEAPAEQTPGAGPFDATRWDRPADVTRAESAADRWETTDTIYAKPGPAPAYPPRPPAASAFPPPSAPPPSAPSSSAPPPWAPADPGRGSGGGRRAAFIVVLVLVVLAAGGGAYALVSRSSGHSAAQSSGQPTVSSGAGATASSSPGSVTSAASASASPSASPSASAKPRPTQTGAVRVAAGVAGNSAAPQVEAFLNRYFNSINTRNYSEWNSLLDAQGQQGDSQSTFESGYATTKDSNEIITGITETGGGDVTANVSFTSRQSPADSIDHSACNDWQLSFFLEPQDGGYVATTPPSGYHAAYTDC